MCSGLGSDSMALSHVWQGHLGGHLAFTNLKITELNNNHTAHMPTPEETDF